MCPFGCGQRLCASPVRVTLLPGVLSVFWNRVTKWLFCLNVIILNFCSCLKREQSKQTTKQNRHRPEAIEPDSLASDAGVPRTLHCPRAGDSLQPACIPGWFHYGLTRHHGVVCKSGPRESVIIADRPQIYQSPGGGDLGLFFNHSFLQSQRLVRAFRSATEQGST